MSTMSAYFEVEQKYQRHKLNEMKEQIAASLPSMNWCHRFENKFGFLLHTINLVELNYSNYVLIKHIYSIGRFNS